jgi:uncharacterized protein YndB with AHSA1/START domain
VSSALPEPEGHFEQYLVIAAPPETVFACFFKPDALRAWWQAVRSVTTPVPLGVYAIEWAPTPYRDDVLGALGGVFYGTVIDVQGKHAFFVANAYWVPPQGEPIGPMGLEITCNPDPAGCRLHVRQVGYEPAPRWKRYYAVVARGWQVSLIALKRYAEDRGPAAG